MTENTTVAGAAQTIEEENRSLHQRLTKLSSENNMLKYRNEVLMQMVTHSPMVSCVLLIVWLCSSP